MGVFVLAGQVADPPDSISAPLHETFSSSVGIYRFDIDAVGGNWLALKSEGTLYRRADSVYHELWRHELPNALRPRLAVVSNAGAVVTLDDWEQMKSDDAIVLYDPLGAITVQYSFKDVQKVLGADLRTLIDAAHPGMGLWMSGRPQWAPSESALVIPAARRKLVLSVPGGALSVK